MSARTIRLDLLHGRIVRDAAGRRVGRLVDVHAEERAGDLVIVEYLLGPAALVRRMGRSLLSAVGLRAGREPIRIPWDQVDLTDPEHPRLRGTLRG